MPYIKTDKRNVYSEFVEKTITTIVRNEMPPMIRIEYFGYFVGRLCENYLDVVPATNLFNSLTFDTGHRKSIEDCATKIGSLINSSNPMESSGELNYIISTILRGISGEHPESTPANYGFFCASRGVIECYLEFLKDVTSNQTNKLLTLRKLVIVRGVLNDVISEYYRRKVSEYEDSKIAENGDLW